MPPARRRRDQAECGPTRGVHIDRLLRHEDHAVIALEVEMARLRLPADLELGHDGRVRKLHRADQFGSGH